MKPNIKLIPATIVLICLFALTSMVLVTLDGCAGTPNTVAFKGAVTTRTSVQTAMGLYNVWIGEQHKKGIDTTATDLKVQAAFNKWKDAQLAVLDVGRLNAIAASTNSGGGVMSAVEDAITNASQYKADLLALLTDLGIKL